MEGVSTGDGLSGGLKTARLTSVLGCVCVCGGGKISQVADYSMN